LYLIIIVFCCRHKKNIDLSGGQSTARRTRKAKERVEKMRKMYGMESPNKQVLKKIPM